MITFLKGTIIDLEDSSITIFTGSMGFAVNIDTSLTSLAVDQEVSIFCHMSVRENDISLWGFLNKQQLTLFKLLIAVSGVGPKTAQALIFKIGYQNIISAIKTNNPEGIKSSGVGVKTAQKIILDLKNKVENLIGNLVTEAYTKQENSLRDELVMALDSLGYRTQDMQSTINQIISENSQITDLNDLIKISLRYL